jgi:hypothetical protein
MSVPLTELPFGFSGRIFQSSISFGQYDLHGEVYDCFCEEQIGGIVLLASDEECLHKTGCNWRVLYHKEGFQMGLSSGFDVISPVRSRHRSNNTSRA